VRVDLVRSRKRRAFDFLVRHGFGRLAGAIKAFVRWTMLFPQTLLERLAVASLRKLDREVASDAAVAQRFADELLVGVPISRKGFLVDVGCASGRNVLLLRSLGYNVVGVDLQCYGDIWAQEADRFFCANAYALPFADKSADYVLAHAVLEHCRYDDQVIAEIRRILKDDAIAFVMVPQHTLYNRLWKRCKDRDHYREYTAEGLASLMERGGFEMVTVRRRFVYAPICMFCLNQLFGITAGLLGGARGHFRLLEWIDKFVPENERGLIYAVCQKKNLGAG
jgi:SAM-dependent methyltransferase